MISLENLHLDRDRIPLEMLGDIIKVFLIGITPDSQDEYRRFNLIRSEKTNAYAEWSDIFKLRKPLISSLKSDPKNPVLYKLGCQLESIYKDI